MLKAPNEDKQIQSKMIVLFCRVPRDNSKSITGRQRTKSWCASQINCLGLRNKWNLNKSNNYFIIVVLGERA